MQENVKNLIGGEWVSSTGDEQLTIMNPADGETVLATLNCSSAQDVRSAVAAANGAFPEWRDRPVVHRCRILFRIKEMLENRQEELARRLTLENGKTLAESRGSVRRGIEVVEFAAGMPSLMKGNMIENIAGNVDGSQYREPLGVAAGICPFNFPAMVPLWMFPVAVACGNTFVLKPSEKCPGTAAMLGEIFTEGGLPPGVLNIVHGGRDTVESLITSPDLQAVSFVGSTPAAKNVWEKGTATHKRVQALGGAKNYVIVMPDAHPDETVKGVIGSSFGCAGERCMASSVVVLVGEAEKLLTKIVDAAKQIQVGDGLDPKTQMGPLITREHKQRVINYIESGVSEGAELLLDGRSLTVAGKPNGYYVGPTIFDHVKQDMSIARDEIFGPVLSLMRAADLEEALNLLNNSNYGNGASIFTSSGGAARRFRNRVQCGMIGINSGVPAPMAFFSFGGHKQSLFGDLRIHGPDGIEFYTRKKSVIERWFDSGKTGSIWNP